MLFTLSIAQTLQILAKRPTSDDELLYKVAACRLFSWMMLSPKNDETSNDEEGMYLFCLLTVAQSLQTQSRTKIFEFIEIMGLRTVVENGLLGVLKNETDVDSEGNVKFPYAPRDYVHAAHIVDFFLRAPKRSQPSLNKAYLYLSGGYGLKGLEKFRETKFKEIWRTHKDVAPFHWLNHFWYPTLWDLDPKQADEFNTSIHSIIYGDELSKYIGEVAWVIERLKALVDARSIGEDGYGYIGPDILPIKVETIPLHYSSIRRINRAKSSKSDNNEEYHD